jgi:hypothetical protein
MNWRAMAREDSVVPVREEMVGAYVGETARKGNDAGQRGAFSAPHFRVNAG